jgi:hypothetical protein
MGFLNPTGYDAFFGTYTVHQKAGTIRILLEGSNLFKNIGKTYIRDVRVMGNSLVIQLPATSVYGTPTTRTLLFQKSV